MYITEYGCVFLKLGSSNIGGNRVHSHTLFGSLPLAHNAQHSLVGASVSEAPLVDSTDALSR